MSHDIAAAPPEVYAPPTAPGFDPESPAFRRDPYPVYARMLETTPTCWHTGGDDPRRGAWYVFGHADVSAALRDRRLTRQAPGAAEHATVCPHHDAMAPYVAMRRRWVLYSDPPQHTRLRTVITRSFTPALLAALRHEAREVTHELLDSLETSRNAELIGAFAAALPARIMESLLGIESTEREHFRSLAPIVATAMHVDHRAATYASAAEAVVALSTLLRDKLRRRQTHPRHDLLSAMLHADGDDARMTEDELVANVVLLLLAGQETTANLIGNGIQTLLERPEIAQRMREHPALDEPAIEEILRFESPAQMTDRFATEELVIGGETVRRGEQVWLVMGAANRDPRVFPAPDCFSLERRSSGHRAFGLGIHHCPGAQLGRLEGTIAVGEFLRRFPDARLARAQPVWRPSRYLRGLQELSVVLG